MKQMLVVVVVMLSVVGGVAFAQEGTPESASSDSLALAEQFLHAMETRDADTITQLLAEDVTLIQPMTFSGLPDPEFVTEGRDATMEYLGRVFIGFSQIRFVDPDYTVSADGSRVFVEARGDFVTLLGSMTYENIYVFRLDIADGQVTFIKEYANPVPASAALGIPLGISAEATPES